METEETIDNATSGFGGAIGQSTRFDDRSWAVFGMIEYALGERWTVAGEARFTQDRKEVSVLRVGNAPATTGLVLLDYEDDETFDNVTPVVTLTRRFSNGNSLYGRLATGFRAGGFNQVPPLDGPTAYDEEYSVSAEIGTKLLMMDGRLSMEVSAYHMWVDDVQVVTRGPSTLGVLTFLQNGGDATVYGLDLQFRSRVQIAATGGSLTGTVGASTMAGEYRSGTVENSAGGGVLETVSIDGNDFPRLRDLTLSATLNYTQPLFGETWGFAMLNLQTEQGGWEDSLNRDALDDFAKLDARLGVRRRNLTISVYAKNVTNEIYLIEDLGNQWYWNTPRTYGVEARYQWEQ